MNFDAISKDPAWDESYPPFSKMFTFSVAGDDLITTAYIAQGQGPHRTIVFFHGFPGAEKNYDLVQILRRAGNNVIVFHYRGSWGSQGSYSINNILEDADAAIAMLKTDSVRASCRIDPSNIILMGSSLGAFTAMVTLAHHPEIKSMAFLVGFNFGRYGKYLIGDESRIVKARELWSDSFAPLRGTNKEKFVSEIIENRNAWDLVDFAKTLKDKNLLFIAGTHDTIADIPNHHQPIVEILESSDQNRLKAVVLETDHECSNSRIAVAELLLAWLE